jgi:large subunit ribosomal protein L4e
LFCICKYRTLILSNFHRQRSGPLIIYDPDKDGRELVRAFRIPGVETSSVFALNLLQLAPGGHLGRFIVWTSSAFAALDMIYASTTRPNCTEEGFPSSNIVSNADINHLINSSEVQAVVCPAKGLLRRRELLCRRRTNSRKLL